MKLRTPILYFLLLFIFSTQATGIVLAQSNELTQAYNRATKLYQQGKFVEAEPYAKEAVKLATKEFGPESPAVALVVNNLAELYRGLGRYGEAESLHKRALAIREKAFGSEHLAVGQSLNNLAATYLAQSRYNEAEPLFKRALAIYRKAVGPKHPQTAYVLNNLAELYRNLGRNAEAEPLQKLALEAWEKAVGPTHPAVATALNNLALIYQAQGRFEEAEPLIKRSAEIAEKVFGAGHHKVAAALTNLANLYMQQDRCEEAEPLLVRCLEMFEQNLGPEHPNVAIALNNLGETYRRLERYTEAEPLLQRALKIWEKVDKPDHSQMGAVLNNLAVVYRALGRYVEAEPLFKRALTSTEKAFGPEHIKVAYVLENYARLLRENLWRAGEADALEERATAIRGTSERIVKYTSEIWVKPDATLTVRETIEVESKGRDIKHGIFVSFHDDYGKTDRSTAMDGVEIQSVTRNGKAEAFFKKKYAKGFRLYIGKEDVLISHGRHVYEIAYRMKGRIRVSDNVNTLEWRVVGGGWPFVIDQASVSVHLPEGESFLKTDATAGHQDSMSAVEVKGLQTANVASFHTTRMLKANELFNVEVSWTKRR